jgi:hypothetical protein
MASKLTPLAAGVDGAAKFSDDSVFRYWLERRWDAALPQYAYILLNPSMAGADVDDETSRKLARMTLAKGGGGFDLVNLFALVDTNQDGLRYPEAVGETIEANNAWIDRVVGRADVLVLGWGDGRSNGAGGRARYEAVRRRANEVWPLVRFGHPNCFLKERPNASGQPPHPLYLKDDSLMVPYVAPAPA